MGEGEEWVGEVGEERGGRGVGGGVGEEWEEGGWGSGRRGWERSGRRGGGGGGGWGEEWEEGGGWREGNEREIQGGRGGRKRLILFFQMEREV